MNCCANVIATGEALLIECWHDHCFVVLPHQHQPAHLRYPAHNHIPYFGRVPAAHNTILMANQFVRRA
jgi:hypothetical protein